MSQREFILVLLRVGIGVGELLLKPKRFLITSVGLCRLMFCVEEAQVVECGCKVSQSILTPRLLGKNFSLKRYRFLESRASQLDAPLLFVQQGEVVV